MKNTRDATRWKSAIECGQRLDGRAGPGGPVCRLCSARSCIASSCVRAVWQSTTSPRATEEEEAVDKHSCMLCVCVLLLQAVLDDNGGCHYARAWEGRACLMAAASRGADGRRKSAQTAISAHALTHGRRSGCSRGSARARGAEAGRRLRQGLPAPDQGPSSGLDRVDVPAAARHVVRRERNGDKRGPSTFRSSKSASQACWRTRHVPNSSPRVRPRVSP